jgi:long-chain acyl-CoA synthetase
VLLFRGSEEAAQAAVVAANQGLADYQRVRRWKIWPELDLPRTSTGKIRRGAVTEWVNAQRSDGGIDDAGADALLALVLSITGARPDRRHDAARLEEDLQLDSLGRVQLQAELEERLGLTLSDAMLERAATLGDLRRALGMSKEDPAGNGVAPPPLAQIADPLTGPREIYPHWTWWWPVQAMRVVFFDCVLRPLVWLLADPEVRWEAGTSVGFHVRKSGRGAPGRVDSSQPLLLIANHVSTYDMPLVLYALPGRMRRHVAAAMAANILEDWRACRNQGAWFLNALGPLTYLVVTFVFNVFPLPRSAGFRQSFRHAGEALDRGYNVLVFPEGHRSEDGKLHRFRPGIGLLVEESKAQVLPVALSGLGGMKVGKERWFRSGKLRVVVGSPMSFSGEMSAEEITERLHDEIARLLE